MSLAAASPIHRRLNRVEAGLRREAPELAQLFQRWERGEPQPAGRLSRRRLIRRRIATAMVAGLCAAWLAATLLSGGPALAMAAASVALALAAARLVVWLRFSEVRREPKLRSPVPSSFLARPRTQKT